ncbi:hypothetical protein [Nonomuraea angiospora]
MIRNIHVQQLRDIVEQQERDLAGWRFLLAQAEQGERAGTVMPDPLMPAGQAWPAPPVPPLPRGVEPYPATGGSVFDGTLPPNQEAKLGALASEHDAYAQTPKARDEEQKWQQA